MNIDKNLSGRLAKIREAIGITQAKFAESLKIKRSTLAGLENGLAPISDRNVERLCYTFKVNETWFRTGNGEMFAPRPYPSDVYGMDGRDLTQDEQELIQTYSKLIPKIQDNVLEYAKDKLDLQNYRRNEEIGTVLPSSVASESHEPVCDVVEFPCFGEVSPGKFIDETSNPGEFCRFPRQALKGYPKERFFVIRVAGYSVPQAGISEGDIAVIYRTDKPMDGKTMLVLYKNSSLLAQVACRDGKVFILGEDGAETEVQPPEYRIQGVLACCVKEFDI